jgi:hypothetical protein
MPATGTTLARFTSVAIHPDTEAAELYGSARVAGFPADPSLNLRRFAGRTIENLTFTHVYLGGAAAWRADDIQRIDWALPAAMQDSQLNNVLAQYFPDGKPRTTFKPSRIVDGAIPDRVYRDTIESLVASLDQSGSLSGFDLTTSAFCLLLPEGVVLVDGVSTGQNGVDSKHGLGGYHGSIHAKRGSKTETVYYAVGVYSEGSNGIAVFADAWKNTCAVFYHELCEARTDPDVEDAIRAGNSPQATDFLGWYSLQAGEIGDIPLEEAGANIASVVREVKLAAGGKTVPVQFMWSNAVSGPEGPIPRKHATAPNARVSSA